MEYLWIFILLVAFQPVVQRKLLEASRRRLLGKIESERGSRVILLAHRQETMSFLGFPLMRFIDINDSEEVLRAVDTTDPEVPIDLVLHTPGGLVLASLQIARAIHAHRGKVTVFVPHYAMSGGTLVALAADEIVMSPNAVLGPVDPVIGQYPGASVLRAIAQKPIAEVDDETLILADQARMAIDQIRENVTSMLADDFDRDKASGIATALSEGRWTHDHGLSVSEARDLGLPVSTEMPPDFMRLMTLFPQPVRQQPGVEYIPGRKRAGERTAGRG